MPGILWSYEDLCNPTASGSEQDYTDGLLRPTRTGGNKNVKRILSLCFVLALCAAVPSFAETVEGILMDNMCSGMVQKKGFDAAKGHTKECALMDNCKASGFAVVTSDGKVIKLDDKGNQMAIKALEGSSKEDNLTVKVEGKVSGDSIAVAALAIPGAQGCQKPRGRPRSPTGWLHAGRPPDTKLRLRRARQ